MGKLSNTREKTYQVIDSNGDVWTDGSMGLGNPQIQHGNWWSVCC